jgi:hypothetical protein
MVHGRRLDETRKRRPKRVIVEVLIFVVLSIVALGMGLGSPTGKLW